MTATRLSPRPTAIGFALSVLLMGVWHTACMSSASATATLSPATPPSALSKSEATAESALWPQFVSNAFGFSLRHPPEWKASEEQQSDYFLSPETFGSGPELLHYYVYVSEIAYPQRLPFVEVATASLSDELQRAFTYTPTTIGTYRVYETTDMPSRSGALTVFFEAEQRYLAVALTPYNAQWPWPAQDQYVHLFRTMLQTVRLTR